jgi:hypothetical protein
MSITGLSLMSDHHRGKGDEVVRIFKACNVVLGQLFIPESQQSLSRMAQSGF